MEPGKGYSVTLRLTNPPRVAVNLAEAKVGVVPHAGGTRLVGTMELSGVNERIDERRVDGILAAAGAFVREIGAAPDPRGLVTDVAVGMRPMFARGLPVIDRVDGREGLYLSTGHAMMGATLALSSAAALTEFIVSGRRPAILEPFRLDAA
jgi:D-amino-acid dehydrogenase